MRKIFKSVIRSIKVALREVIGDSLYTRLSCIRRGHLLFVPFKPTYNEDWLVSGLNCEFLEEPSFKKAYGSAVEEKLHVFPGIRWRLHVGCWAASHAAKIEGDFVECGVNKGFMSRIIMDYVGFNTLQKVFYLLDTFQGFDEKYLDKEEEDRLRSYATQYPSGDHWAQGIYSPCYDIVVRAFSKYTNVRIVKGSVPETLPQVLSDKVAYLSLDMNCVAPEIAAIEFFWPKLVQGGIVLLDDYGFPGHELQKRAMDLFAAKVGAPILTLPTGQGLIIKCA